MTVRFLSTLLANTENTRDDELNVGENSFPVLAQVTVARRHTSFMHSFTYWAANKHATPTIASIMRTTDISDGSDPLTCVAFKNCAVGSAVVGEVTYMVGCLLCLFG